MASRYKLQYSNSSLAEARIEALRDSYLCPSMSNISSDSAETLTSVLIAPFIGHSIRPSVVKVCISQPQPFSIHPHSVHTP